ncbi:MAG: hypothetical protein JXA23_02440, partial [Bacteroidales bacterium]|nr:hypothetical protein [Bacteroidales bacterium]
MQKIVILSLNISEKKGTVKHPVPSISLTKNGIEGDAHSGPWNRQVSMLGIESIRRFEREAKRTIRFGEFAENITTEGIELWKCQPLDRFIGDTFELEVTQIGKKCHGNSCAIFKEVGNCVMPKEGIFVRVVDRRTSGQADKRTSGQVIENQEIEHRQSTIDNRQSTINRLTPDSSLLYQPKIFSARIITLSDRAFCGEYEDKS